MKTPINYIGITSLIAGGIALLGSRYFDQQDKGMALVKGISSAEVATPAKTVSSGGYIADPHICPADRPAKVNVERQDPTAYPGIGAMATRIDPAKGGWTAHVDAWADGKPVAMHIDIHYRLECVPRLAPAALVASGGVKDIPQCPVGAVLLGLGSADGQPLMCERLDVSE